MGTEVEAPRWSELGIRVGDLLEAERMADSLARPAETRRRSLLATMLPIGAALGLAGLLGVVLLLVGW